MQDTVTAVVRELSRIVNSFIRMRGFKHGAKTCAAMTARIESRGRSGFVLTFATGIENGGQR